MGMVLSSFDEQSVQVLIIFPSFPQAASMRVVQSPNSWPQGTVSSDDGEFGPPSPPGVGNVASSHAAKSNVHIIKKMIPKSNRFFISHHSPFLQKQVFVPFYRKLQ
ncbi:MAG: hypothetical protein IJ009_03765 [Clostridia bacterium]|nr:hypothetical protein [Clostridia bacterium]